MKIISICILASAVSLFAACDGSNEKNQKPQHDMGNMDKDSMQLPTNDDNPVKAVSATFKDLDPKAAASVAGIIGHYMHIKNALANDNSDNAADGGKAMTSALTALDKSLFTPEQKKVFDDIQDDLQEHAEHVGKNSDNIKQQREHFAMMSEDAYALVKAFGSAQPVYHDHCPMFNDGKGAMWLSESEEIKNPYYGSEMITCGKVEEIIK
jgi:hypothetical protein